MKNIYHWLVTLGLIAMTMLTQGAWAATCTSIASGNWDAAGTWSCTAGTWPAAGDTVIIVSPHTVTLNNNYSATNLTINAGATLWDNGRRLTLSGNAVISGTYDGTGNGGRLTMTGAGTTLSGNGTFIDIGRLQIDGSVTIPAGSSLELTLGSEIRVDGTLTINGTITGAGQTPGNRILRVNGGGVLVVGGTGSINAPNSDGQIRSGGAATNNGSVLLQGLTTQGTGTWTNNPGSICSGPPVCPQIPLVASINTADPNPATTTNVSWTVVFNTNVTGVDAGDFTLVQGGGMVGATITSVTGGGTTWTVVASTAGNTGTLGLNLVDNDSIRDAGLTTLGGAGAGNGNFTGQVYTINTPVSTVTASPTLCVNDASIGVPTGNWTGLTNVGTQNGVYAQASVANSDITNYLKCTGYGFSIPAGSVISGITVGPWLNATWTMRDNAMQLVKGGVIQPTNLATGTNIPNGGGAFAPAPTQFIYGSSSNLWGNTWTVADINSANFGAAFAAQRGGFATTQQAGVDAMPITIDYTLPAFPSVSSINLASTNPTNPATAVSWTIIFSASVTGVDGADFALVQGGGVTGASITSVTGSGTTWTVTANTGSGTGTLELNLVDNDSIVDGGGKKLGGTGAGNGNFTGQVYTVEVPLTCIADNFSAGLDTSLWSVVSVAGPFTPAVVSVGGGDFRLRLTDTGGGEATFATLKRTFPGAGNKIVVEIDYFAYGGSGADGIAITFSDSAIASTTGGFGGSLGYANRTGIDGFGGGWLGIGLDEYGNFPNTNEGRQGYPAGWVAPAPANVAAGFYSTNLSIRGSGSAQTGYYLLANTGVLATPVAPAGGAAGATPYRYRFTIDHSNGTNAWVTVERDLTAPLGDAYTVVVPTFDVKAANSGQAAVPPSWLLSFTGSTGGSTNFHELKQVNVCANSIAGGGPHHFEIQHASGTGVTCTPSTLTIKACADAACTTPYTAGVTGTLSATGAPSVNWSGGTGFTIPGGSSTVTKDVQVTTVGSVVFDATSTPAPTAVTTCNFGAPSCTFTASDAGFLVSAPNHAAETASTLTVQAVKKADNSLSCVPAFASTAKTVNLKCAYTNPGTGTLPVRVGGAALNATNNLAAACDAGGANVSLTFNASGISTPSIQYADVGQMSITAGYTGTAGTLDAGLNMTGSGSFISAPSSFAFSAVTAGTIKAGDPFSATVTARNAAGNATPNFGKESTPEGVTIGTTLVSPAGGSNPPLANNVIAGGAFTNGAATVSNLSWGEVGNIDLTAALSSANYLASGVAGATGTSATVGPFIPHHFDTTVVPTATVPMPCPTGLACPALYNGFIYSGQPFSVQVRARNLAGGVTTNYDGTLGFSKAVTLTGWDALGSTVTQNPGPGALANGTVAATSFSAGVATTAVPTYTFATVPTAPTDIYLRAVDTDSVSSLRSVPATSVEGGVKVASGRVKIGNRHGSELLDLPMTVRVQYYSGTRWLVSTSDSVTQFNSDINPAGNIVPTIVKGPLALPDVGIVSPGPVTFGSGVTTITLAKPGVAGSADITMNAPSYLPSTTGRATFGVYKGAKQFIYQREDY